MQMTGPKKKSDNTLGPPCSALQAGREMLLSLKGDSSSMFAAHAPLLQQTTQQSSRVHVRVLQRTCKVSTVNCLAVQQLSHLVSLKASIDNF